jgi:hypothetical protein
VELRIFAEWDALHCICSVSKVRNANEDYHGLDAVLPLGEVGIDLPLAEMYETVEFIPEAEEDGQAG